MTNEALINRSSVVLLRVNIKILKGITVNTKTTLSLKNSFRQAIRWNMLGSMAYEGLRIAHQVALLSIMDRASYGHAGVLFSLMFLAINLANAAADTTIPAFIEIFTKSKHSFFKTFLPYLFLQVPILIMGGGVAGLIYKKSLPTSSIGIGLKLFVAIVLFEGIRMIMRSFLHSVFINKVTMFIELIIMIAYMGAIWSDIIIYGRPVTLALIFIPYLVTSIMAVALLGAIIIWHVAALPSEKYQTQPGLWRRIVKARLFNCSTKFSKQLFTGNFLVPLFAHKFGLASAGIFKFSSYLADAIRGVINVVVGFSGGALFARLKSSKPAEKKQAFYTMSEKLNSIMYCCLIFLTVNYYHFWIDAPNSIIILSGLFLLIMLLEHFCSVYEQMHIVEEKTPLLFYAKIVEVAIAGGTIAFVTSPLPLLTLLIGARFSSFFILAASAFRSWGISPHFKVRSGLIAVVALVSIFIFIVHKLYLHGYNNFI